MKKCSHVTPIIFALFIIFCCSAIPGCSQTEKSSTSVLKRVMLIKYKAEIAQVDIDKVRDTIYGLVQKIPGMLSAEWGVDTKFGFERPYTYCIILKFASEKACKAYEEHPDHQAMKQAGPAMVENFFRMDYWTGKAIHEMVSDERTQK